jgi:hypothetical protein
MLLLEQNDEWLVGRCYLSETSLALVIVSDHADPSATTGTRRWPSSPRPEQTSHAGDHQLHHKTRRAQIAPNDATSWR